MIHFNIRIDLQAYLSSKTVEVSSSCYLFNTLYIRIKRHSLRRQCNDKIVHSVGNPPNKTSNLSIYSYNSNTSYFLQSLNLVNCSYQTKLTFYALLISSCICRFLRYRMIKWITFLELHNMFYVLMQTTKKLKGSVLQ